MLLLILCLGFIVILMTAAVPAENETDRAQRLQHPHE